MRRPFTHTISALVVAFTTLASRTILAQTPPAPTVSIHAGAVLSADANPQTQPLWMPSVEVPLGRRFAFQWEGSRWSNTTTIPTKRAHLSAGFWTSVPDDRPIPSTRTVTTINVNLLFRAGTARWSGFAGGGVNAQETADDLGGRASACRATVFALPELCIVPGGFVTVIRSHRFSPQLTAGAEVALVGPIAAVGTVRVAGSDQGVATTVTGGVRVAFGSRAATTAPARTHHVRNGALIGLATGLALSQLATCNTWGDDCPHPRVWVPYSMLFGGGIGAAAGAGIGGLVNLAR